MLSDFLPRRKDATEYNSLNNCISTVQDWAKWRRFVEKEKNLTKKKIQYLLKKIKRHPVQPKYSLNNVHKNLQHQVARHVYGNLLCHATFQL